ncbi:hypothetical protein Tco_0721666 [Tanacetum coccineum]
MKTYFGCSFDYIEYHGSFEVKFEGNQRRILLVDQLTAKVFRVYNRVHQKSTKIVSMWIIFLKGKMNQKEKGLLFHDSSSIGNKAVSEAITNDAQNKDSDESTVVKEVPLTIDDQYSTEGREVIESDPFKRY